MGSPIQFNNGYSTKKYLVGAILACLSCSMSSMTFARSDIDELNADAKKSKDSKVVVTGTRIKKIDINNLSPVISLSRQDIDKLGYANVKDVIDNLTQNAGGTFDNSFTFGFTPGASAVNLRGLGFGQTLTLIDGRRLPIYPIGINGTTNFVDLSSIPMAFVERIEVLTDGASAVYGSDAVAGVINVITRKDIEGISTNFRTSLTADGGYETHRFNLLTGARNGDTQLDVIFDYWLQEPLWASERDYAASDVSNPLGSYSSGGASFLGLETLTVYQDPNCGTAEGALAGAGIPDVALEIYTPNDQWCGYDRSQHRQLIAPQERFSLMTRIHYEISDELSFFSRVGFSELTTKTQLEPNFYGGGFLTGFGAGVPNFGGILLPTDSNNPTAGTPFEEVGVFVRRLVEFGPRRSTIENDAVNLLGGFEGSFANGRYDWTLGLSYNKTELDIDSNNIRLSGLNREVDFGLDLFQPIPQTLVDFLSFTAHQKANSTNRLIDFSITGDLDIEFAGGPMRFAVALEDVRESYFDKPDPIILNGDGFDGSSDGQGERSHAGIGFELSLPFSTDFEMDIALRYDGYDDDSMVGSAFSPRLSVGYRPSEKILTRFSWGKSFRAPDMQRLFGGTALGFNDIRDPDNGDIIVQSVQILNASNIDLSEERGTNINFGLVWNIDENFDFSADIFDISMNDVVASPSAQFIVNACSQFDLLCDFVIRDSQGTLNGNDAFVITGPVNFAKQETRGIDLSVNYQWNNTLGQWESMFTTTWIQAFNFQAVKDINKVDNISLGVFPEFRANLIFDWQNDQNGATAKFSFVDEVSGLFCVVCDNSQYISSWTTLDTNFRYQFSDFTRISLGINNLLNKAPPTDPTQVNWPWYTNAGGYYNAIGREFYMQLDTHF